MIKWIAYIREIGVEGTTIYYRGEGTNLTIESRKRHIPHANTIGTRDRTTFWLLRDGAELKEFNRLKDAKTYAEEANNAT